MLQWAYLITVGVISAQKKMLKLLTAWEENMPMMEKAVEKFLFSVPELSAERHENGNLCNLRFGSRLFKKKTQDTVF